MAENPFIAPQEDFAAPSPAQPQLQADGEVSELEVDGDCLVVADGAVLPPRCITTNQAVEEPPRRKVLAWAPPWIYVLIFVHILVLILVYYLVRKRVTVHYHLSPEAASRRRRLLVVAGLSGPIWIGAIVASVAMMVRDMQGAEVLAIVGGIGIVVALIMGARWSADLRVQRHKDGRFWIKGCSREFLDSLQ